MNYLQLVQALHRETGISGAAPQAVTGQVGQLANLVEWIQRAWLDIQVDRPDWWFMRQQATVTTVTGVADYGPADFSGAPSVMRWDATRFTIEPVGQPELKSLLPETPFDLWFETRSRSFDVRPQSRPQLFTFVDPITIRLDPKPDGAYIVTGNYTSAPVVLAQNTDVPSLPEHYHMLIVYRAMIHFADFHDAPERFNLALAKYNEMLSHLMRDATPRVRITAGPVA